MSRYIPPDGRPQIDLSMLPRRERRALVKAGRVRESKGVPGQDSPDPPLVAAIVYALQRSPDGLSAAELSADLDEMLTDVTRVLISLRAAGRVVSDPRGDVLPRTRWHLVGLPSPGHAA